MNFNIIAYCFYLPIMSYITIAVGGMFHKNGKHFIDALFPNDLEIAHRINNLLLVGYYMLNLGYVALVISLWNDVENWETVFSSVSQNSGTIILILAIMHYLNMFFIYLFASKRINNHTNT